VNSWLHYRVLLIIVTVLCGHSPLQPVLAATDNIEMVEKLVTESRAAEQIKASGDASALALQRQAVESIAQAKAARARGDEESVRSALQRAESALFAAARAVGDPAATDKQQSEYERCRNSSQALLEALDRVAEEKGAQSRAAQVQQHASGLLAQASADARSGRTASAKVSACNAYLSVKLAVTQLRSGDRLVRSLDFSSPQEEYLYEVDRHKTHRMLIDVLRQDKLSDPRFVKVMEAPLAAAESLRVKGEVLGEQGQYEDAIKTLEQATQQLIRAIRAAGIYIPG
jgi:tetratricopeptide (TPR) repeat protein